MLPLKRNLAPRIELHVVARDPLARVHYSGVVTCRGFLDDGFLDDGNQVTFCTDSRSEKIPQMNANPCGHVCWYFTNTREQFRLDGKLQLVDATVEDSGLAKVRYTCNLSPLTSLP